MLNERQREAAIKRIADASEKFAIASAALGVYEGITGAVLLALAFLTVSIILTVRGVR